MLALGVIAAVTRPSKRALAPPKGRRTRRISAASSADAGFSTALDAHFPGLAGRNEFQSIAPLALLLTNPGSVPVHAYTVCWSIETPTGHYETRRFFCSKPGDRRQGTQGRLLVSGKRPLLTPGGARLVTPYGNWLPKHYQPGASLDWGKTGARGALGHFLQGELARASQPRVWLDAAVFADRRVSGPDQYQLARRFREWRHAQHDESVAIRKLLKQGTAADSIADVLVAHATVPRAGTGTSPLGGRDWVRVEATARYQRARRYHAQFLLKVLERHGLPGLTQAVTATARRMRVRRARHKPQGGSNRG